MEELQTRWGSVVSGKGESIAQAASLSEEEWESVRRQALGAGPATGDREVSRQRGKVRYSWSLVWSRQVRESCT